MAYLGIAILTIVSVAAVFIGIVGILDFMLNKEAAIWNRYYDFYK